MHLSLGQIIIVAILLWAVDRYIDRKIQTWTDYYLHQYSHSSSSSHRRPVQNFATLSGTNEGTRTAQSIRNGLDPLYHTSALDNPSFPLMPPVAPQQNWVANQQQRYYLEQQSSAPQEPPRASCLGESNTGFQPITASNVGYLSSLRCDEGSRSSTIMPITADNSPVGMGNGIHQAVELTPQQMATRNQDSLYLQRYIDQLDDTSGAEATQNFLPYTARWGNH